MAMSATTRSTIRFSDRVLTMKESPTLAVLNRATALIGQGIDVVDFGPGEPDFATPPAVSEAGKRAIDAGYTKYTNASGLKAVREAIAARYNTRYRLGLTMEHVIAGNGGKQELSRSGRVRRRQGRLRQDHLGRALPSGHERHRRRRDRADPRRDPELAVQSHRGRDPRGRAEEDRRLVRRARRVLGLRRDL
jgi:hypothetical protein